MAKRQTTLLLKKSGVPGKIPTELQLGELAINFSDVILYASGTSTNSILPIGWDRVSKTGDTMSGTLYTPSISATTISATTYYGLPSIFGGDYLPLSGGTVYGGTVFQSGVTANTISNVEYIDFNTGTTNPSGVGGRVFFDNIRKSLSYYDVDNNNVSIGMGQQLYTRVHNDTGAILPKGSVISITGTSNNLPSAILSVNKHEINSARPIGLSAENIPSGGDGLVLNNGILEGLTLNTFSNGDTLYLSDTTPGGYVSSTSQLAFTARTNEIGYVLQTGTTTGKIYVNINNEDSNLSLTDIERNILEGNVISNGVYEYTGMTVASTTTINVAPARGWIVRNTYDYAILPDVINLFYTGGTNISLPNISSADSTYFLINSGSTLVQQTTFPTPQQRRENIFLGKVNHPNRTSILNINNTVDYDVSPMSSLRDLWSPIKLINQGIIPSPNGVNLSFNTSAGTLWGNGINWHNNQLNPNSVSISGKTPASFFYRTQTGGTSSSVTVIDPTKYDVGGVITSISPSGSNDATNQRIYLYPTGVINVLYGQTRYATLSEAIASIQSETFIPYPNAETTGILIGVLSVRNDIVADGEPLTNPNYAKFTLVSKFGESFGGTGGLSTTTLQQAYNNSTNPEIITNSTLNAFQIRGGTGSDLDDNFIIENNSGEVKGRWLGNGGLSATTMSASSLTINPIGTTTDLLNVYTSSGNKSLVVDLNGYVYNRGAGGISTNTAFGQNTLTNTGTSSSNTAFGYNALRDNQSSLNTGIGTNSLIENTTGSSNTAIGVNSLRFKLTGDDNVAIGVNSLYQNVTGSTNTAVGVASQQNSLVVDNTSIGYRSLYLNTVGLQNTALGTSSVRSNTTGSYNTGVGFGSLQLNTTGNYNVGLGRYAGYGNTTGTGNVAIGPNTMFASSSGSSNTAIGYQSMFSNVSGSNNVNIGYETAYFLTGGSSNVNVGYRSGYRNLTGATTVAVGQEALYNSLVGSNVGVGYRSLYTNTIGTNNTALGDSSLLLNTTGSNNIGIGYLGNYGNTTGSGNIGIGPSALSTSYTGSANTAIGFESMRFLSSASNNTSVGYQALRTVSSGGDNSAFGRYAGYSTTTGIRNVFNGTDAFFTNTTGSNNIGIGYRAGFSSLSGGNNVVIGHESMYSSTGVSSTVAVGYRSLYLNTTGALNTSIGTESLNKNTVGSNNVSFGYRSLYENLSGNSNTSIGYGSSLSNNSGAFNTAVGNTAFYFNTTGSYNTTLGNESMYNNTTGLANIAIGSNALFNNTTGSYNTAVGYNTALGITSGSNNTIIGSRVSGLSGLSDSLILADGAGVIKLSADSAHHLFIPNSPSSGSTSDRILTRSTSGEIREIDTTTVVLKTKSGVVVFTSFTGSPYTYDVVFVTPFTDALYSPQIIGYDSRSWTISNVTSSGFRIETNSTTILTNNVYWTVTKHGEN